MQTDRDLPEETRARLRNIFDVIRRRTVAEEVQIPFGCPCDPCPVAVVEGETREVWFHAAVFNVKTGECKILA